MNLDDLLGGPPKHLERYAPPWAARRRTICGRGLDDVTAWLSFEEARKLIETLGMQRARLVMCQTCLGSTHAVKSPSAWGQQPAQIVADWAAQGRWEGAPGADEIKYELLGLGRLVEAHRGEYDALVAGFAHDEIALRRKAKEFGR